jgi:hypothetical protein
MGHHTQVQADPKEVKRAQEMWHNVTQAGKWGIVAIAALLIALALVFIDF